MAGIGEETYASLRGQFQGDLLRPGDAAYEAARSVWNGMFRRKPAVIARCADVSDIQHAIRAAREIGLATAIRCGGHSLAGFSTCDGLVIHSRACERSRSIQCGSGHGSAAAVCSGRWTKPRSKPDWCFRQAWFHTPERPGWSWVAALDG